MDLSNFWWQAAAAAPPVGIRNSLRFRSAQFLQRTFLGAAGPGVSYDEKSTVSVWVKRSKFDSYQYIIEGYQTESSRTTLYFDGIKESKIACWKLNAQAVANEAPPSYRNPASWYHIVSTHEANTASLSGTWTLYINGEQVHTATETNAAIPFYPTWVQGDVGATIYTTIGAYVNGTYGFEGYLAEMHVTQGTILPPTDFGEFDANGVWVPKAVNLSQAQYGANGFYLDFSDPADIGADRSGNGNNFTPTGFDFDSSTNWYSGPDHTEDSPANNWLTDYNLIPAGTVSVVASAPENNWFWQKNQRTWNQQQITQGVLPTSGKWWFEWGNVFSNSGASISYVVTGFQDLDNARTTTVNTYPGYSSGYGWYNPRPNIGTSAWVHNNVETVIAPSINLANSTRYKIGFAVDCDQATPTVQLWQNLVNDYDDTVGWTKVGDVTLDRADVEAGLVAVSSVYFGNVGPRFESTNPTTDAAGYKILTSEVLPAAQIPNGRDHFQAITDTGANILTAAQTAFPNGLWWVKDRANANQHQLVDSVRGGNQAVECPQQAEQTAYTNPLGDSVAWCWKAGGAPVENTNGATTSQVSANVDAGFSIVTYPGTNNGALDLNMYTVGHGLSKAPELIISRCYENIATSSAPDALTWYVNHSYDYSKFLALNTNGAARDVSISGQTAQDPTATVFPTYWINGSNVLNFNYVAYCWHSVPGYSAFGSYTGNGSADGPFIYTGHKSALILIKSITAAGDWHIYDSTREISNPETLPLRPNLTNAESAVGSIDFLSNGFKLRSAAPINASATYIYASFAEHPSGGSNVAPANAR